MPKKKSKKCQRSASSMWIKMKDGTFSLIIEPKKSIAAQKSLFSEVKNNEIKKLASKKHPNEKKSKNQNAKAENVSQQDTNSSCSFEKLSNFEVCSSPPDSIYELANDFVSVENAENTKKPDDLDKPLIDIPLNCVQSNSTETQSEYGAPSQSEASEDNAFYENLFADNKPTYVTASTDVFPCDNTDSDSEFVASETVKFSINNDQFMAEYNRIKYQIGHLDLIEKEHSYLKIITEAPIELEFNPNEIIIHQNLLNITRIKEPVRPEVLNPNNEVNIGFAMLNLVRIQFSANEPFLAKYENTIYFVGKKLYREYVYLLSRTHKNAGTAIRICRDRINVDTQSRTLDVFKISTIISSKNVCVISGDNSQQTEFPAHNSIRRYMVNNNPPHEIVEIEPALLYSSVHDNCTEIYAENNFPFKKYKKEAIQEEWNKENEEQDLADYGPLELVPLKPYAVPNIMKGFDGTKKRNKAEIFQSHFGCTLNMETIRSDMTDYVNGYKFMIWLEENEQMRYLAEFNQNHIKIDYYMGQQFYFIVTDPELIAAVEANLLDRFVLKPNFGIIQRKDEIWGQVLRISDQKLYIEIFPESISMVQNVYMYELYDIIFTINRLPFQLQHYALDFVKEQKLFTRLIDNKLYLSKNDKFSASLWLKTMENLTLQYEGTMLDQLNAEQETAVKNILGKMNSMEGLTSDESSTLINMNKLPYVLFGPPGTGKTRTLVAAIEQIVRTTNQNVLVCAMSNAACDELAERLLNVLKKDEMYRFFAKSYRNDNINPKIAENSNYARDGKIYYPSLKFLYQFRVFVCTLVSAGCLTRARKYPKVWRPNHFGYVIIDECTSAHETTCLIPIAGLCTSTREIHAKIVLAGDPKQLDAVTKSECAKSLGYNISWLERLCSTNLYSRNASTGQFNEMFITQLVKNYRSHPYILRVSNELFYENKLEAYAPEGQINWYINSPFLPSKQFPIIFRSINGSCEQSVERSRYNDVEIDEVIKVIRRLLPPKSNVLGLKSIKQSDIGVVTPYSKQCFRLTQRLRRLNFDQVVVGTAEVFQGKEKPIIIISTVRSNGEMGFVTDPRRLNVILTRAMCLVMIIGHSETLALDTNWRHVIELCKENNSFIPENQVF